MTGLAIVAALYNIGDKADLGGDLTAGERRIRDAEAEAPLRIGHVIGEPGRRTFTPDWAGAGKANAVGRRLSPVGAPLGGYRWQRRLARQRAHQRGRRRRETHLCESCPWTGEMRWMRDRLCPGCGRNTLVLEIPF